MFKLVISDDEGKTTVVPLVRDEVTIGRKEGNTIRLTERNVSRRHARLRKANGAFSVEDLSSYNGVKVNGKRIGGEAKLKAGDQITIGDYLLALQLEAGADAGAPPPAPSARVGGPPARLVMLTPPAPGAEYALSKDVVRIGRAEDLDVWVNHRSISREHAEIHKSASGGFELHDLGSANGVRVNGEPADLRELVPGDVVELGQVRFRYVPAGEDYVFDADRTIQMEAVVAPAPAPSKGPVYAALAIVVIAVIVGAMIAMSGEEQDPAGVVTPIAAPGGALGPAAGAADTSSAEADRAAQTCETARAAGELEQAVAQAERALALVPGHGVATTCRAAAQAAQAEQAAFARGRSALDSGNFDDAYFAFEELPIDSALRSRPEVEQAREGYARAHLTRGQELLSEDPDQAADEAESVLTVEGISRDLRRDAQSLLASARRSGRPAAARSTASAPVAATAMTTRPGRTGGRATAAEAPAAAAAEEGSGGDDDPMNLATACLRRGDNNCVVQVLEGGRARSARSLALLIETYRNMGNTPAAVRHMVTFVRRYPTDRRTPRYQQFLDARGN